MNVDSHVTLNSVRLHHYKNLLFHWQRPDVNQGILLDTKLPFYEEGSDRGGGVFDYFCAFLNSDAFSWQNKHIMSFSPTYFTNLI